MHDITKVELSDTCSHLYYQKQVYTPGTFMLSSFDSPIVCEFTKPVKMDGGEWDQDTEKLAKTALIFTDELSHTTPSDGISVETCPSFPCGAANTIAESLFENLHQISYPWTSTSGWVVDPNLNAGMNFVFGTPSRTVFIWGMVFLKSQFRKTLTFKLRIKYHVDIQNGVYLMSQYISPDNLDETMIEITIRPEDLDDAGVYRFEDPKDPGKPMGFVCNKLRLQGFGSAGPSILNFDFIGTYYDFDTASTGKHTNNKDDNFNDPVLGQYLSKGTIFRNEQILFSIFDFD